MSRSAVSYARVREMLSEAAGGALVSEEAVGAVAGELEERLSEIVRRAGERYAREIAAKHAQGLRARGDVRVDHVVEEAEVGQIASGDVL